MVKCWMYGIPQQSPLKFPISYEEIWMQILCMYSIFIWLSTKYHMTLIGPINIITGLKTNRTSPWGFLINSILWFCHRT